MRRSSSSDTAISRTHQQIRLGDSTFWAGVLRYHPQANSFLSLSLLLTLFSPFSYFSLLFCSECMCCCWLRAVEINLQMSARHSHRTKCKKKAIANRKKKIGREREKDKKTLCVVLASQLAQEPTHKNVHSKDVYAS